MEEEATYFPNEESRATCVLFVGAVRHPNLVVEHCRVPSTVASGEVLLALKLASVCPMDLPSILRCSTTAHTSSPRRETVPRVPGHEAVGEVVLSRRSDVQTGDRLVFAALGGCGDCSNCSQFGHILDCPKLVRYGESCYTSSPGLSGSYSSHMIVRAGTWIAKVPSCLPDRTALAATCRLAPLLWGIQRAMTLTPNTTKNALVQGCGMRGILSCAVLLSHGFSVYCTDLDQTRLRLAEKFGAHPIYGAAENPEELWSMVPSGFEMVVRACKSRQVLGVALAALVHGGTYLLLGGASVGGDNGALPLAAVTTKALHLLGVPEYLPEGLQNAIGFLEATHNKFPYESLFSPPYIFNDIQAALRVASEKKFLRVTLKTDIN